MKKFIDNILKVIIVSCLIVLSFTAGVWSHKELKSDVSSFSSKPDVPEESSVGILSDRPPVHSLLMRVSAYCPCAICCGDYSDGITASGKKAMVGMIAAPKKYPFGTILNIAGTEYVVEDRGGAITSDVFIRDGRTVYGRLDVFFPTHQAALNWGVQYLMVYEVNQ